MSLDELELAAQFPARSRLASRSVDGRRVVVGRVRRGRPGRPADPGDDLDDGGRRPHRARRAHPARASSSTPRAPTSARASPRSTAGAVSPARSRAAPARPDVRDRRRARRVRARRCCSASSTSSIMTERGYAFVNGPVMVASSPASTSPRTNSAARRRSKASPGSRSAVVADRDAAADMVIEELLAYLPDHADARTRPIGRRPTRSTGPAREAGELIPESSTGSYDVRQVAEAIVDEDSLFEIRATVGRQRGDRVRDARRTTRRHRRQSADEPRRHARHPSLAEGGPVRRVVRRVQPAAASRWSTRRASIRARISSGAA